MTQLYLMNINPEMLNRYASEQCSEEEKLLVNKWLEDDSWASLDNTIPVKDEVGDEIWKDVSQATVLVKATKWWKYLSVASVLFLIGFSFFYFKSENLDSLTFSNKSFDTSKFFAETHYDVILGGNTNASIDLINNKLSFSGDFIIKPKRDFKLLDTDHNTLSFKAGREYFVSDSPDFGKIIVFQKSDLAFLPSSMQNKIIAQFQDI